MTLTPGYGTASLTSLGVTPPFHLQNDAGSTSLTAACP